MMKLSTLWSLDQTYSADGRSPLVDRIAARWRHDLGSVRFFRSSANFVSLLGVDEERAFLRFASSTERSTQHIRNELRLLQRLTDAGHAVARPRPSRTGNLMETVQTNGGTFHAVVFDDLWGNPRELTELSLPCFEAWGGTVGALHATLASCAVEVDHGAGKPTWQRALSHIAAHGQCLSPCVVREAARLRSVLSTLPADASHYGLLHGDLELDNLIWRKDGIAVLDFDGYSTGWYMLDIAKALSEPLDAGMGPGSPEFGSFVTGYRREHALTDESLALLPDFSSLSKMLDYASVHRALDTPAERAPVDWMRDLICRLQAGMHEYERECERINGG